MKQERYSNQSKIFQEITASKFQEKHAVKFNSSSYEGLCPESKTEIHQVFSMKFFEILE